MPLRIAEASRVARKIVTGVVLCVILEPAFADEGMWTFDAPPLDALKAKHEFMPAPGWLDALRLSAVRVGGASGSLVSAAGLVLTNHHVAMSCIQKLSTEGNDLVRDGFLASKRADERACPDMEVRRLESQEDVSTEMRAAIKSTTEALVNAERQAAIAAIENACMAKSGLRCEVVTLYRGAAYQLHRYRVWTDVRLVFAPELRVSFFGGDPDNFVYPRFDLDLSLLRVYDNGKPIKTVHHLQWAKKGVSDGDLVFAAGHPYSTDRLVTLAQLEFERDARYPLQIGSAKRQRLALQQFGARSPEAARRAADNLFGTENWLKAMLGEARALNDGALLAKKAAEEAQLRESFGHPTGQPNPWTAIEGATEKEAAALKELWAVGYGYRTLFSIAGGIVELVNERALPDGERLSAYRDSALPRVLLRLTADAPIYKDLEIARQSSSWEEATDLLGAAHPFVRLVRNGKSPLVAATAVIDGSRLDRVDVRRALIDGGLTAVNASDDPLIVLARAVYPMRRKLAKFEEVEIDTPIRAAADALEKIRFKRFGSNAYPDATGTLRLGYGTVRGYDADGILTPWRTNFGGLYARRDAFGGQAPFDLPARWIDRQRDLEAATPLNFVSTLDIIGGNSGSPVVDRAGELVGLIFDGNLEGLGARFAYTDDKARAIAVDTRAIREALSKVYGAGALVEEMTGR